MTHTGITIWAATIGLVALLEAPAATVQAGASTAYESAARLTWTRRGRRHDELDRFNQCIAVVETSAHLDLLSEQGRLHRTELDGVRHYTVN